MDTWQVWVFVATHGVHLFVKQESSENLAKVAADKVLKDGYAEIPSSGPASFFLPLGSGPDHVVYVKEAPEYTPVELGLSKVNGLFGVFQKAAEPITP